MHDEAPFRLSATLRRDRIGDSGVSPFNGPAGVILLCTLLFAGCSRAKLPTPTLIALPRSGQGLLVEEKDELLTKRYWERFEMDPSELSAWEATLFCRLGAPVATPLRVLAGAPSWADRSKVQLHRDCHGSTKTTDGHVTDDAAVMVDVGNPARVTVYVEIRE